MTPLELWELAEGYYWREERDWQRRKAIAWETGHLVGTAIGIIFGSGGAYPSYHEFVLGIPSQPKKTAEDYRRDYQDLKDFFLKYN